jgi:hypothetical protein
MTNNDLQNTTQKTKDWVVRTPLYMRFKWGCLEGQAISVSDTVVKNPMTSHERRKEQHINIHDKKHCSNFLFLRGDGWHPINRCNPATSFCLYLSQDLDLQRHMSWLFCVQWVQLRWEVIVCFVDIGGIDDHHCLHFLFVFSELRWEEVICFVDKSDSTHHFFRNACTMSGSLRFSQFSGCWLILSVYIIMSFDFPFVRLFGVR